MLGSDQGAAWVSQSFATELCLQVLHIYPFDLLGDFLGMGIAFTHTEDAHAEVRDNFQAGNQAC